MNFTPQLFLILFIHFCFGTTLFFFADETFIIALTYNFVLQYYVDCRKLIERIMLENDRNIAFTKAQITNSSMFIETHVRNVLQLLMQFYLLYLTILPCNCKIQKCHLNYMNSGFSLSSLELRNTYNILIFRNKLNSALEFYKSKQKYKLY